MYAIDRSDSLEHHGILGQKWGVRRYQNADGSLTAAGRRHYNVNYKASQIRRDISIYGKKGAKRISDAMDRGIPISGARSLEADNYNKAKRESRKGANAGRAIGYIAGIAGGAAVAALTISQIRKIPYERIMRYSKNPENYKTAVKMKQIVSDPGYRNLILIGSSVVSGIIGMRIGESIGRNAPLAANGYTKSGKHISGKMYRQLREREYMESGQN